jgi:predicted CXXCH cytochrome family protein
MSTAPRHASWRRLALSLAAALLVLAWPAQAGQYLSSAHGSATYGVLRTTMPQYSQGHCGHCHEQHALVGGSEPSPTGGPDSYLLFEPPAESQTSNVCLKCHTSTGSLQSGGITTNYSYAYTFGGYTAGGTYDADIKAAFSHTTTGSSHYLSDITSQALGKTMTNMAGTTWSLAATLSPCDACHNPHAAQRAHPISLAGGKLNTTLSRPSDHGNLWGDDSTERLNANTGYISPYWFGSTTRYEPGNDTTNDGSNAPGYVKFCTDCHNPNNTIYSTNPRLPGTPRNLLQPNWTTTSSADLHGAKTGSAEALRAPYTGTHTLSCLDCHEPHGSTSNLFLLRKSVNGVAVSFTAYDRTNYEGFCLTTCHSSKGSPHSPNTNCQNCHNHGDKF